ncbi:MAG TPA: sigma-54 dependent transcriptional regulator, partial [Polyangiaceae bacterium]
MQNTILLIEDDESLAALVTHDLGARGHLVHAVASAEEGMRALDERDFDVVLTDLSLGGMMNGVELCAHLHGARPDVPVIVMTAHGTLATAVDAIRASAYDFVTKPFEMPQLALVVDRAVGLRMLRRELARLRETAAGASALHGIIGRSAPIEHVRELVSRVADTDATVLITGESGTGKELIAKALHDSSSRREHPFVAINCAAMPESLLESELFGHSRGAFTDAKAARAGLFVRADHGTVFLDEIGEMPLGMQAKLLRALQERTVRPVGCDQEVAFDARVVAATHRDLQVEIAEKRFREDLYYRINVMHIHSPPLRARGADTLLLAHRFVEQVAAQSKRNVRGMSAAVAQKLVAFPWPGNVR